MSARFVRASGTLLLLASLCALLAPADDIPKAAWKRPIGQPLENAGTKKPALDGGHIDDGYWQGARSEERRVGKECRSRWSPYH